MLRFSIQPSVHPSPSHLLLKGFKFLEYPIVYHIMYLKEVQAQAAFVQYSNLDFTSHIFSNFFSLISSSVLLLTFRTLNYIVCSFFNERKRNIFNITYTATKYQMPWLLFSVVSEVNQTFCQHYLCFNGFHSNYNVPPIRRIKNKSITWSKADVFFCGV